MLRKVLTKSGRRILRAIKKLSTARMAKNFEGLQPNTVPWSPAFRDLDAISVSWSLPSLDTKSVDTYMTYVGDGFDEYLSPRCCHCNEHEENQRNENRENEMII